MTDVIPFPARPAPAKFFCSLYLHDWAGSYDDADHDAIGAVLDGVEKLEKSEPLLAQLLLDCLQGLPQERQHEIASLIGAA